MWLFNGSACLRALQFGLAVLLVPTIWSNLANAQEGRIEEADVVRTEDRGALDRESLVAAQLHVPEPRRQGPADGPHPALHRACSRTVCHVRQSRPHKPTFEARTSPKPGNSEPRSR